MNHRRRESALERWAVQWARSHEIVVCKLDNPVGIPDRVFFLPGGCPVLIEFKDTAGNLSDVQKFYQNKFDKMHYIVGIVRSKEEFLKLVNCQLLHYVYHLYDSHKHLIYVGRSYAPDKRHSAAERRYAMPLTMSIVYTTADLDKARKREVDDILKLKPKFNKCATSSKGTFGISPTDEWLTKLIESHKGKHPSKETLTKLSAIRKGHQVSQLTRLKISAAITGTKRSEETKQKISASKLGTVVSAEIKAKTRTAMLRVWEDRRNNGYADSEDGKRRTALIRAATKAQWKKRKKGGTA